MGERIMHGFPSREEALRDFFAAWEVSIQEELVPLDEAVGRITSRNIVSQINLPVVRAASLDGIAVKSADFTQGIPLTSSWRLGIDYVYVDMGDDFDDAFDAVIIREKVQITDEGLVVLDNDVQVEPYINVRRAGATIAKGDLVLKAGLPIRPTDLAALAMGGSAMVPVRRKPRIAFIPTGSELVPAGMRPLRGQNIDTNSLMVKHMLREYGAEPLIFPLVRDDEKALEEALYEALEVADAVVINGGSAVGTEDFNVRLIEEKGKVIHHYIAAVPGRPLMLAVVEGKPVVDLPGPPLAAYYGTQWCIQAVVARYLGIPLAKNPTVEITAPVSISCPAHMANIARYEVFRDEEGKYSFTVCDFKKGSMAACMTSNAQRVSPLGEEGFTEGEQIMVELLRGEEYL